MHVHKINRICESPFFLEFKIAVVGNDNVETDEQFTHISRSNASMSNNHQIKPFNAILLKIRLDRWYFANNKNNIQNRHVQNTTCFPGRTTRIKKTSKFAQK